MKVIEVERYLINMEKKGLIFTEDRDGVKIYYLVDKRSRIRDRRSIETRRNLYDFIVKNPGIHLSSIAESLNMRVSLVEYHLKQLEKKNLISSVKKEGGYYRRYYAEDGNIGFEDKKILGLLRIEAPLKIVLLLLKKHRLRHRDILKNLDIASSTLSYHLNQLIEQGIIEVNQYGEEKGYKLKDEKKIITLLRKCELHQVIEGFLDLWKEFEFFKVK